MKERVLKSAAAMALAFGLASAARADDCQITVGVVMELTGPAGEYGQAGAKSVEMAFRDLNDAGGPHGCKLVADTRDSQSQGALAVDAANQLIGQAYATTTNPAGVTGDGLALAARAGAALRDIEFVGFHPTVLWDAEGRGQCPLITEALRGAGAVIVDDSGRPAVPDSLAPRDVVSAAMLERISASGAPHLWLDATPVQRLDDRFPTVSAACREHGIDPAASPIPVAPGAHYACGGVRADMTGRTSLPGVFAVGEVARTGVHGANRLASNSLTEAMIMGRRERRPARPRAAARCDPRAVRG